MVGKLVGINHFDWNWNWMFGSLPPKIPDIKYFNYISGMSFEYRGISVSGVEFHNDNYYSYYSLGLSGPFHQKVCQGHRCVLGIAHKWTCWSAWCPYVHFAKAGALDSKVWGEIFLPASEQSQNGEPWQYLWRSGEGAKSQKQKTKCKIREPIGISCFGLPRNANPDAWERSM